MKKNYTFTSSGSKRAIKIKERELLDVLSYRRSLEITLEQAQRDFWAQYLDVSKYQLAIGKNYLWISAAISGSLFTIYLKVQEHYSLYSCSGIFFICGFLASIIGFGLALYSLPTVNGYTVPHKRGWSSFSILAYNKLKKKHKNSYESFLTILINKTDIATHLNVDENVRRGKKYRKVYKVLLLSFLLSSLSAITYVSPIVYKKYAPIMLSYMEKTMTDSNDENKKQKSTNSEIKKPPNPNINSTKRRVVDHVEPDKNSGTDILNEESK